MIGRSGRAARRTVFLATAAWAVAVLTGLGLAAPASLAAPSSGGPCSLKIDVNAQQDGTQVVSGTLTASDNSPVVSAAITITVAGQSYGATTIDDGTFSADVVIERPGDYTVTVHTPATPRCSNSAEAKKSIKVALTVDLRLDAHTVSAPAGGGVTVSGRLAAQGQGLAGTIVDLTPSWNAQGSATALTGGDGSFISTLTAPAQPSDSLSVQVSFPGDGYYPPAQATVAVQVVAAVESPTPTVASAAASGPASATTSAGPQQSAGVSSPWRAGSHLFIVLIVFVVVAALATGTFLVIAVVSRQRRGLAADERRGFGSDFGVVDDDGHGIDVGLSGLGLGDVAPADGLDGAR